MWSTRIPAFAISSCTLARATSKSLPVVTVYSKSIGVYYRTLPPHTMLHRFSITLITGTLLLSPIASAQETGMMDDHTAREEAEGRELWQRMEREEVGCKDLTDEQFAALGEFFMGEMTGDSHEAMNAIMTRMRGEEGEEQMQVIFAFIALW